MGKMHSFALPRIVGQVDDNFGEIDFLYLAQLILTYLTKKYDQFH